MEETPPGQRPQPQPAHASPPFPAAPFTPPPRVFSPALAARGTPSPGSGPGHAPAHLSTPPGPPVFSSPLRPAAVPFRATPASPHPVPFAAAGGGYSSSSASASLPTSSAPHFLNGAATPHGDLAPAPSPLQGDGLDNPYVQFSANKVPLSSLPLAAVMNALLVELIYKCADIITVPFGSRTEHKSWNKFSFMDKIIQSNPCFIRSLTRSCNLC